MTHSKAETGNKELPGFSDFVDKVNKKSVLQHQHKSKGNKEKSKSGKEGI
jgi:hypothetical protein